MPPVAPALSDAHFMRLYRTDLVMHGISEEECDRYCNCPTETNLPHAIPIPPPVQHLQDINPESIAPIWGMLTCPALPLHDALYEGTPPPPQGSTYTCGGLGCIRRGGTSQAVRQAVGGGCRSGWGWLLSVTNADSGWALAGRPRRGGGVSPPLPMPPCRGAEEEYWGLLACITAPENAPTPRSCESVCQWMACQRGQQNSGLMVSLMDRSTHRHVEPRSLTFAPPFRFSPPSRRARQQPPPPTPPPPAAGDRQRVGRPRRRHRRHQKWSPHPRGWGRRHRGAASWQPRKGGGGRAGGPQPALGKPPSHGHGQATGASRVARALHPKQAQLGSRGRGGQHGEHGASPRTSPPSRSTRPLRSGLHQGGYRDVAKG